MKRRESKFIDTKRILRKKISERKGLQRLKQKGKLKKKKLGQEERGGKRSLEMGVQEAGKEG